MIRGVLLGLAAMVCLIWACGEDSSTSTTSSSNSGLKGVANESSRLISKDQLVGEWHGQFIHLDPCSGNRMEFRVDFTFEDSSYGFYKAESDTTRYNCPHLYAYGAWATDGLALWLQNHAYYLQDCFWYPIAAQNHPVWFEGDTLFILESQVAYSDSVVTFGYRDTFKLERVE